MKKILVINALLMVSLWAFAQQPAAKKPAASPEAAFTQQFGDSEIQVQYARPSARGRKIFGGLVPFDSLWRTGAGDCTTLNFKEEVIVGDKKMTAGKYSLFTIPTATDWTIVLNSNTAMHGTNGYSKEKDVQRFTVKSTKIDRFYETFTIEINDFTPQGSASLNLMWENTMVKIPLKSPWFMATENAAAVAPKDAKTDVSAGHDMSKMDKPMTQNSKPETQNPKNTEGVKTDANTGHDMSKIQNKEEFKTLDLKAQFVSVLAAYYEIKNALVADNGVLAATKAKAMKTALGAIDTKSWIAKDRSFYEPLAKKLETDAEHIGDNAGKIDHQREHFITLSKNIAEVTKTLKINSETTYLQFCPMANDGKGAFWLSKEDKVKNPYYGKSMLSCGSVKETLK